MVFFNDINVWAVLGAAVFSMVLGMAWYSPKVFGTEWMRLLGMTPADIDEAKKKGMGRTYAMAFVGSIVSAYVLSYFNVLSDALTFAEGAWTGFLVWFGFIAPVMMGGVLWEGRSVKLYAINAGHYLVSYPLIGGLLAMLL